jgi:hypothetical protein
MRQSIAAVALIRRQEQGQTLWLAQWNLHWQKYNFVSGHKRLGESYHQCIEREIGEELQLHKGLDFSVADASLAHLEYIAWSESAQAETQYTMELFEVELTHEACQRVDANPSNRWLTTEEIHLGQCRDGAPVSDTMRVLLSKIDKLDS